VELAQLYALARRWLRLLILCVALGMTIAFIVASVLPKAYESTTTMLVGQPFTANSDTLAANRLQAQQYADLATLRPMLQLVINAVGLQESPEELANHVLVRPSRTSNLLTVTVTNTNPGNAAAIANEVARQLITLSLDPKNPSAVNLTVVEPAVPAPSPSSPKVVLITAMGGAAGVLLAVAIIANVLRSAARRERAAAAVGSEAMRWPQR
jgi:succinoglycan biosynthesis transport protein ExoP